MASLLPTQPSSLFASNHTTKTTGNSYHPLYYFQKPKYSKLIPLYHFQNIKYSKALSALPSDDSLSGIVDDNPNMPDSVKLAFAKAAAYRNNKLSKQSEQVEKALESGTSPDGAMQDSRLSDGASGKNLEMDPNPSKFENQDPRFEQSENDTKTEDMYKPKVSTWGVFPRPGNISKAYGGGRVIRPGEALETEEDKKEKERRSKELIAAYESKFKKGLVVDPKIKADCETALQEGINLMDRGRLRQAIPFFEKVMKDMIFESKLHGMAAFQLAVCLDSLQRSSEAKEMYKKLRSHPNYEVNTKARHFAFSFEAMDFMKVKSSYLSKTTGYETYFDSFVETKNAYTAIKPIQEDESSGLESLDQILPYIVLMVSPIIIVLLVAARKLLHL